MQKLLIFALVKNGTDLLLIVGISTFLIKSHFDGLLPLKFDNVGALGHFSQFENPLATQEYLLNLRNYTYDSVLINDVNIGELNRILLSC